MANNFDSNFTRKLARVFLEKFDSERVLSKNVNTQLLQGRFDPSTGTQVDFKRPTDYVSVRTTSGDVSTNTASDIITGKATGTVQDYFTVHVDYNEADEALKMDQLDQLLAPMATRIKTDLEVDFAGFMMKNGNLVSGSSGTGVSTWDHIADAGAMLQSIGVPMDMPWCYAVNPYTQRALASTNRSLGAGGVAGEMIKQASERAIITRNFAGFNVMTATTLASYTTGSGADRTGALKASPDVTYVTHKDTMQQTLQLNGLATGMVISPGETIEIAGRNRLNLSTRQTILDETGATVLFRGTVVTGATVAGGSATVVISGPAIFESGGAYNTVASAPVSGDVVSLGGGAVNKVVQPNLFWHPQAFGIGSVPIKKLYSTDTIATTSDGLQFRVSKGTSFLENKQIVRFDFRPAYAVLNPFFAGQSFGGG
jgi:hypothetical protein